MHACNCVIVTHTPISDPTFAVFSLQLRRRPTLSVTAAVAVAVTVSAVAVLMKQHEADNVDNQAGDADVQHPVRVFYLVHVRQSLDRFHEDREAQRDEEYRVDECTENLRSCPAVRVLVRVHL